MLNVINNRSWKIQLKPGSRGLTDRRIRTTLLRPWDTCTLSATNLSRELLCGFICGLFNDTFNSLDFIASKVMKMSEWWTGRDGEGGGLDLFQCTIPGFVCMDWGKLRNTSERIIGVPVEVRSRHVLKTRREIYRRVNLLIFSGDSFRSWTLIGLKVAVFWHDIV